MNILIDKCSRNQTDEFGNRIDHVSCERVNILLLVFRVIIYS